MLAEELGQEQVQGLGQELGLGLELVLLAPTARAQQGRCWQQTGSPEWTQRLARRTT